MVELILPDLRFKDIHKSKNKKAYKEVIPKVLRKILDWGIEKDPDESFWEFVRNRNKKWTESELVYLNSTSSDEFPISLLIKLIPVVCRGIRPYGFSEWTPGNPNQIESLLTETIQLHNSWSDRPSEFFMNLKDTLHQLLAVSGNKYNVPFREMKDEIVKDLETISSSSLSDDEEYCLKLQCKILSDGIEEMSNSWRRDHSTDMIPLSSIQIVRNLVFHDLLLQYDTANDVQPVEMSSLNILKLWPGMKKMPRIIIVEGETGSGKSILLKHIAQDYYLENGQTVSFEDVEPYEFLLYLDASTSNAETFEEYLNNALPNTLSGTSIGDSRIATKDIRSLILIENIDDIHCNSMELVMDIFKHFIENMSGTCIVTGRPYNKSQFSNYLKNHGYDYAVCNIKEIDDEASKLLFLQRYEKQAREINRNYNFVRQFQLLNEEVKASIDRPLILVLFCSLQVNSFDTNRWSFGMNIFQFILEIMERKMLQNIKQTFNNGGDTCKSLIRTLYNLSILELDEGSMSIEAVKLHQFFTSRHVEIMREYGFNVYDFVSFALVRYIPHYSSNRANTFQYFHKNFQEYLSSQALMRRILISSDDTTKDIISHSVSKTALPSHHIIRYTEVLKHVMRSLMYQNEIDGVLKETRLTEIVDLLVEGGITSFRYWGETVVSCSLDRNLARKVANIVERINWTATSMRFMKAVHLLIEFRQPDELVINLPLSTETPEFLRDLLQKISECYQNKLILNLRHSFKNYIPCELFLNRLNDSTITLHTFRGCLDGMSGSLPSCLIQSINLHVSLLNPFHHQLRELQGSNHYLDVLTQFAPPTDWSRPLPTSGCFQPSLIIENVPEEGQTQAALMVKCLAPTDSKYWDISLKHTSLTDAELDELLAILKLSDVISTHCEGEEETRSKWWKKSLQHSDGIYCTGNHRDGKRCIGIYLPENRK